MADAAERSTAIFAIRMPFCSTPLARAAILPRLRAMQKRITLEVMQEDRPEHGPDAGDESPDGDVRGRGFPQILHDRSRTAGAELHKLLMSLSAGAVGVFFLALTAKSDPPLSLPQKIAMFIAMFSMAAATFAGIIDWYADCRRNYFWGSALQNRGKERRELFRSRDRWLRVERFAGKCLLGMFALGIVASGVYMTLRVFDK